MRIKNNLSRLMGEKRMSMAEVSRLTGLSHTTVFKIYHDKVTQIGLATVAKLCYALDCTVGELFEYIPD